MDAGVEVRKGRWLVCEESGGMKGGGSGVALEAGRWGGSNC